MSGDFVEVRDEPRHRRRFENEFARVYDVLVPPGDTTLYHRHCEDTLYVSLADVAVRDQSFGSEETQMIELPPGFSICRPHHAEPLVHRITNIGTSDMKMIGVEVRSTPAAVASKALETSTHELRWETERLRVYGLNLAPQQETGELEYDFSGITIFLTRCSVGICGIDQTERVVSCEPGTTIWHAGPTSLSLRNAGEEVLAALVAEWR